MTLSRFLRDYVYIPLGGNRKGGLRTYHNLMATFLIGGLWHGADWTFVFWGFLHGLAIIIQKIWSKLGFKLWTWLAWLITFNFVNVAWIFFRAEEWNDAIKVLSSMFSFKDLAMTINYLQILVIFCSFIIILFFKNSINFYNDKFQFTMIRNMAFIVFMTISILTIRLGNSNVFLYFNF